MQNSRLRYSGEGFICMEDPQRDRCQAETRRSNAPNKGPTKSCRGMRPGTAAHWRSASGGVHPALIKLLLLVCNILFNIQTPAFPFSCCIVPASSCLSSFCSFGGLVLPTSIRFPRPLAERVTEHRRSKLGHHYSCATFLDCYTTHHSRFARNTVALCSIAVKVPSPQLVAGSHSFSFPGQPTFEGLTCRKNASQEKAFNLYQKVVTHRWLTPTTPLLISLSPQSAAKTRRVLASPATRLLPPIQPSQTFLSPT